MLFVRAYHFSTYAYIKLSLHTKYLKGGIGVFQLTIDLSFVVYVLKGQPLCAKNTESFLNFEVFIKNA